MHIFYMFVQIIIICSHIITIFMITFQIHSFMNIHNMSFQVLFCFSHKFTVITIKNRPFMYSIHMSFQILLILSLIRTNRTSILIFFTRFNLILIYYIIFRLTHSILTLIFPTQHL
ncbi:hypothetical protein PPERSA_02781 [Pseudocohnilembus persalinus]|uniref:Uncharacterized protein n=1 Tax=Pseudocohnilembus persalinus TaxID=266149 RepID=A0A0V0Q8S6_PSEPJ|nr:hypothetical protein PPERSA_02781 [Pseudocohnilembus persalinus]|eukprot:KRW98633.1 hypothetical protein PPERSA_02781 [Pseudocohnilembus persalinus]